MTITLTLEKKKILNLCQEILWEDVVTIRFLSKLEANLVAAFPAVTLGPFYHRFRKEKGQGTAAVQWKLWCFS